MIRAALGNCLERLLDRPFRARDHILRATSRDGLVWQKDERFRYLYPGWHRDRMSYYVGRDGSGELWFRSSVQDGVRWRTELRTSRRVLLLDDIAPGSFGGFCWLGQRLYLARKGDGQSTRSEVIAFDLGDGGARPVALPLSWVDLDTSCVIEDVFVLPAPDGCLHAWLSLTGPERGTTIEQFSSLDGTRWSRRACSLEGFGNYANNPCVVETGSGRWRMYFRTGDQPAIHNAIRSAVSEDLEVWRLEAGRRIAPGGRWDTHGAAFPFVERGADGGYSMYYTGYWGRCAEGEAAARYWASLQQATGPAR